jgi:hypothetical protein
VLIAVNNKAEGSAPLSCVQLAREIASACARLRDESHEHHEHHASAEAVAAAGA